MLYNSKWITSFVSPNPASLFRTGQTELAVFPQQVETGIFCKVFPSRMYEKFSDVKRWLWPQSMRVESTSDLHSLSHLLQSVLFFCIS